MCIRDRLSGDKTAQLLFVAQNKLKKLQNSKRSDLNSKSSMRDSIYNSKLRIQEYNSRKDIMERNANIVKENFPDGVESVTVKGNTFSDGISNELTPIIDDYYDSCLLYTSYEYKGIKQEEGDISKNNDSDNYSIVPSQYLSLIHISGHFRCRFGFEERRY